MKKYLVFFLINRWIYWGLSVLLFNKLVSVAVYYFLDVMRALVILKSFLNVKNIYFLFSLKFICFLVYSCENGQKDGAYLFSWGDSSIYFRVNCPLNCWGRRFMERELIKSFEINIEFIPNKSNRGSEQFHFVGLSNFIKYFQFKRVVSAVSFLFARCYYFFKNGNGKGLIFFISLVIFSGSLLAFGWSYLMVLFPNLDFLYLQNDPNDITFILLCNSEVNGGYRFLKIALIALGIIRILCCHILISTEFMNINNSNRVNK